MWFGRNATASGAGAMQTTSRGASSLERYRPAEVMLMHTAKQFFVPTATAENQEQVFADFARWCGSPVLDPKERVYSITYDHDGVHWTATVGEPLRGWKLHTYKPRGKKREEHKVPVEDPAVVLAIFPG